MARAPRPKRGRSVLESPAGYLVIQVLTIAMLASGCAINYYDSETKEWHFWGVGHIWMKAIPDQNKGKATVEVAAVVRGTETVGLSFGSLEDQANVALGYRRQQRLDVLAKDMAVVDLVWPDGHFVNALLRRGFPDESTGDSENENE